MSNEEKWNDFNWFEWKMKKQNFIISSNTIILFEKNYFSFIYQFNLIQFISFQLIFSFSTNVNLFFFIPINDCIMLIIFMLTDYSKVTATSSNFSYTKHVLCTIMWRITFTSLVLIRIKYLHIHTHNTYHIGTLDRITWSYLNDNFVTNLIKTIITMS